jgi:hypothetical protein
MAATIFTADVPVMAAAPPLISSPVLPDGRVDACRKFDSPLGNIFENSLLEIYESEGARQYRQGPSGCLDCTIRLFAVVAWR